MSWSLVGAEANSAQRSTTTCELRCVARRPVRFEIGAGRPPSDHASDATAGDALRGEARCARRSRT